MSVTKFFKSIHEDVYKVAKAREVLETTSPEADLFLISEAITELASEEVQDEQLVDGIAVLICYILAYTKHYGFTFPDNATIDLSDIEPHIDNKLCMMACVHCYVTVSYQTSGEQHLDLNALAIAAITLYLIGGQTGLDIAGAITEVYQDD